MNYLHLACAYLHEDPADVVSHRVYEDRIVLVVDRGIAGYRKLEVPLETFPVAPEPEPESVAEPEPEATEAARALAEEHGIALASIAGTGAHGRIIVADVKAAIGGDYA